MSSADLGRLVRVPVRDIWTSEAADFTPWLGQAENLIVLAETLGLDLELEAQEKSVGPFRADLLCKDTRTDDWVLIENQLERTDHTHLGQLLTYASGLQAVTIVWVAAQFTEEHRSTLDWLNKITDESFRFFGLEVELWKIGSSPAAPKFNVVSKPNDWSRSVARAARAIDESDLSEIRLLQLEYWTQFHIVLDKVSGPVSGNRKPRPASWMAYSIGRTNFNLSAVMNRPANLVRAEVYIAGDDAKLILAELKKMAPTIEGEVGYQLDWESLPNRRDARISVGLDGVDPENNDEWPKQHQWLAEKLNDLHRAFSNRIRSLDLDAISAV